MNEEIKTENVPVGIVTMLSEQQEQLLQTANQSLEQYAQEVTVAIFLQDLKNCEGR